ncbi:MAG: hypothetical protein M4D80_42650 [Myxococcota bacterium]|nr:hypothetical protein [Myxococcota bacterium]
MRTLLLVVLVACGGSSQPNQPDAARAVDAPPAVGTPRVPAATGPCPTIVPGDVTFAPAGIPPRKVKLTFDPAKASELGPLVIYWHATGSQPAEATYALGATATTITNTGGVIAAPYSDPAAGQFEWYVVNGSPKLDDFVLADEIVACLAPRIDDTHVHSMGMSAGALQTTALSFARSTYVASVATYSGGMPDGFSPANQDPANKFAALIFMGGTSDNVFGLDFKAASERYRSTLSQGGHFAAICDHGKGHEIPLDAAPSVAAFFAAHGYGVTPSPYAGGLPATFPSYCAK